MRQHTRRAKGLPEFFARGVFLIVAASSFPQSRDCELLVVFTQPFGSGRIVGQKKEKKEGAKHCDDALDDEQPAEAF